MDKKSVGARLASVRKSFGLSQAALAERLDSGQSKIGNYEVGLHYPPLDILDMMGKVLGIDPLIILSDESDLEPWGDEGTRQLPGHLSLARLRGFDKVPGRSTAIFPEDLIHRRMPQIDLASVRWVYNPTEAMAPRFGEGAVTFIDPRVNSLDQVVNGQVYAMHAYGRPDIRRIFILGDNHFLLTGDSETDWRLEVSGNDYKKLKIYGRVIDAI